MFPARRTTCRIRRRQQPSRGARYRKGDVRQSRRLIDQVRQYVESAHPIRENMVQHHHQRCAATPQNGYHGGRPSGSVTGKWPGDARSIVLGGGDAGCASVRPNITDQSNGPQSWLAPSRKSPPHLVIGRTLDRRASICSSVAVGDFGPWCHSARADGVEHRAPPLQPLPHGSFRTVIGGLTPWVGDTTQSRSDRASAD